eukprot:gene16288-11646_t
MPIVLISLIDADHQWFKSRFGFAAQQTHRDYAFCAYTILEETPRVMVVPDAQLDARFKANPVVIGPPYVRFYGGASIIVQGQKVGTLCLIDSTPRFNFSADDEATLIDIADTIATMMEERRHMRMDQYLNGVQMHQSLLTLLAQPLHELARASDEARHHLQQAKVAAQTRGLRCDEMAAVQRDADELQRCTERVFLDVSLRFVTRAITLPASHELTPPQTNPSNALLPMHVNRLAITNFFAYNQTPLFTHPDVLSVLTAALVHAIAQSTAFATERVVVFYDASTEALNVSLVVAHQTTDGAAAPSLAALLRDPAASPLGRVLQAAETLLAWVGGRLQCRHGDQQQRLLLSVYATSAAPCEKKPPVECDTLAVLQGLSWKPQVTASVMRELTLRLRRDALSSAHGPAQPQSMERAAQSDGDRTQPTLSMRDKPAPDDSSGLLQTTSEPSSSRRTSHSTQATDALSPRRKPFNASSPCEGDAHREAVRSFATQWVAQWRPPWAGWALWPGATVHPAAQQ